MTGARARMGRPARPITPHEAKVEILRTIARVPQEHREGVLRQVTALTEADGAVPGILESVLRSIKTNAPES